MPKKPKEITCLTVDQFDHLAKKGKIEKIPLVEVTGYMIEASIDIFNRKEKKAWRYAKLGDRKNTTRVLALFDKEAVNPRKRPVLGFQGRVIGTPTRKKIYNEKKWVIIANKIERL